MQIKLMGSNQYTKSNVDSYANLQAVFYCLYVDAQYLYRTQNRVAIRFTANRLWICTRIRICPLRRFSALRRFSFKIRGTQTQNFTVASIFQLSVIGTTQKERICNTCACTFETVYFCLFTSCIQIDQHSDAAFCKVLHEQTFF